MGTLQFILNAVPGPGETSDLAVSMNTASWYLIAGIVAFLILLYLLLALIKPEKF